MRLSADGFIGGPVGEPDWHCPSQSALARGVVYVIGVEVAN
jgi:hypothetical protein